VKAYVRLTQPFYDVSDSKGARDEAEDLKPEDTTGHWWHETLRALAAIDECVVFSWDMEYLLIRRGSLNLVILRIGLVYGPYVNYGQSGSFSRVYSQSWLC
jgi:hypothetical protein